MKIISLFNEITNSFNESFKQNLNPFTLERKIRDVGDLFTLRLYESFLNYFDEQFKKSKDRKQEYYFKQTRTRTLITSLGMITIHSSSYIHKQSKQYYVPLRDILHLDPYQRTTNEAEYQLVKYAMDENMCHAAKHALRNIQVSRSTVSNKIKKLNGSIHEPICKTDNQPDILYIEMDEIHANLQQGGNRICPCAIVHEGYEENFVKRKKLKNIRYFASAKLSYADLWNVIFDYVDKKYDIDKFKNIFISGDGASGIKNYSNCFPNALFVLDKFHYIKKHLNYIFKDDTFLKRIADDYLRHDLIDDFKQLVSSQITKYPDQEKYMKQHRNYLINNLDGIKNQHHTDYHVHCSMEGHVNQAFARYITSSPYGFSLQGLDNKLKLLVYHANNYDLTIEDYYNLKYGNNHYDQVNIKVRQCCNIKYDQKLTTNQPAEYIINTNLPIFDSLNDNIKLKELTANRQEIYII